ncbi:BglG family transcription antiterminator [Enterococcus sp. LJL99]
MILKDREEKLLTVLLKENNFKPARAIAVLLNVSTKTIYQDIDQLEKLVEQYDLSIEKKPRNGIRLNGSDRNKNKLIGDMQSEKNDSSIFNNEYRRVFLFSELLFAREIQSYAFYADKFYISIQTIKKDMDSIKEYLIQQGVELDKNRNLLGQESTIQNAFKNYYEKQTFTITNQGMQDFAIFDNAIIEVVNEFIRPFNHNKNQKNYLICSLRNSILVFLSRSTLGNHCEQRSNSVFSEIENMQLYMTAYEFLEKCNRELDIFFKESDIYHLCSLLLAHGIKPNAPKVNYLLKETIETFIHQMSLLINLDLSQDDDLFNSLLSHIAPMIFRLNMGVSIKNPLKKQIVAQYSTMFNIVKYSVHLLEEVFEVEIPDDETSFLTIHFQLAFEKINSTKHILVVCPNGLGTSQLIYQRIKQTLSTNNVIEKLDFNEFESKNLSGVDLIISAVKLPEQTTVPVSYVSVLPTYEEISIINKKISKIISIEKKFEDETSQLQSYSIDMILDSKLIFLQEEFQSKEEIFKHISHFLFKRGAVTERFESAIFERENIGSTGMDTGVAIPHADPKTVIQTSLVIMTLKKPILWGNTSIHVVVMLSIAEKDMGIARTLISSIYTILSSKENIDKIANYNKKDDIIQFLKQKGCAAND